MVSLIYFDMMIKIFGCQLFFIIITFLVGFICKENMKRVVKVLKGLQFLFLLLMLGHIYFLYLEL